MVATQESATDPFLSEEFINDPVGVVARIRAEDPVHFIPGLGAWMVTRYDDVKSLFTHPSATNDRRAWEHYQEPKSEVARWMAEHSLFAAPPDEHARMRRLVSAALTPRAVKRMESQVKDVVDQFGEPLRDRTDTVDLHAEFTEPIPGTVIGRITGVPQKGEDELRWRQLGRDAVRGVSPFLSDEERLNSENAINEIRDWVAALAAERRKHPQEDLISDLVAAHDESDTMTNEEIVMMITALVAAGTETTTIGGSRGIRTLLQHPDELERLRGDRSLMPSAVDELLRFDFGSFGLPRYAVEDFELRDKTIEKGQLLMLNFHGAHRDPEVYSDPDRLDLGRDNHALAIFGHGPHYCLGANLARQELGCMFDAVLDLLPRDAKLLEDEIEWARFGMFQSIASLPVSFSG